MCIYYKVLPSFPQETWSDAEQLLLCITVSLQPNIIPLCRCSSHTNIIPFTVIVEFQSQSRNNLRENTCRCIIIHEYCSWVNNTIISLSEWLEGSKANDKTPHRAAWGVMGARCGSYCMHHSCSATLQQCHLSAFNRVWQQCLLTGGHTLYELIKM